MKLIRYPGGKQRFLKFILSHLGPGLSSSNYYIEPFVGGASVFFSLRPPDAALSDINAELIDLYKGIRSVPEEVWELYSGFPSTKTGYYKVRDFSVRGCSLAFRAARTLYLNRTCFKGMWRHNAKGGFNIGYGGQDRRWVLSEDILRDASKLLQRANLECVDFEIAIDRAESGDFLFIDPPYCPGKRELFNAFFRFGTFTFRDQLRLVMALVRATRRGALWAVTNTTHPQVLDLYREYSRVYYFPKGTGSRPGLLTSLRKECLILNY